MPKIKEGSATITVKDGVFFNPKMKELRDISVAFLKALNMSGAKLLDSTAATGIRGIRYSKEAKVKDVTLLDINKRAYLNVKANLRANRLRLRAINKSIQEFANTADERFDIVDLDPFGSPQPYVYDLMKILGKSSILMVTATDTAVLCGAHANACYKVYDSKPLHNELCKEVGVRILLSYISRTAAQFSLGVEPLLAISSQHYIRVFVRLEHGSAAAVDSLKENGFGSFCPKCRSFSYRKGIVPQLERSCKNCKGVTESFGQLWLGRLYDKDLTRKIKECCIEGSAAAKITNIANDEIDTPLFYSIPSITKSLRISGTSHYEVIKELKKMGFHATPTQFDPNGVKTAAGIKDVEAAIQRQSTTRSGH